MTILVAVLSFMGGVGLTGAIAYRILRKHEAAYADDPLLSPPNKHVRRLQQAVWSQLKEWQRLGYQLDEQSPENVREVLRCLRWNGIFTVQDGVMTLPNGGTIPIDRLARDLEAGLVDAYQALDEAASIILDYAETLPPGAIDSHPDQVLYSKKFAFEHEIVRLAQMLGLDPDRNEVARFGGAALWQRWSARLFPTPRCDEAHAPPEAVEVAMNVGDEQRIAGRQQRRGTVQINIGRNQRTCGGDFYES